MSMRRSGHTSRGEVSPSEFVVLDSETFPEDLVGLLTSDGNVTGDLLVPLDAEGTNCNPSLGCDGILTGEVLEDLLSLHELVARLSSGDVEH